MGEAKRNSEQLKIWQQSLSSDQNTAADIALTVFRKFVVPLQAIGMCYRLTFLLTELLQNERGIQVEPIVGFVNDGTTKLMASHAWIEMSGKRTDLSLAFTEYPEVQLPGEVLIMDRVFQPGIRYSYSRTQSPESIELAAKLSDDPDFALIAKHKGEEHLSMEQRSGNSTLRRAYLDSAPDGLTYKKFAALILGGGK